MRVEAREGKKSSLFVTLFCQKEFVSFSMSSVLNKLSEYISFYISKHHTFATFVDFSVH